MEMQTRKTGGRRYRKQAACLAAGLVLGIGAHWTYVKGSLGENGNVLERNSYGQGQISYELVAEGILEEEIPLKLTLEERSYTREEAHQVYERILEELPQYILKENPSLNEVRSDLELVTSLEQYGVGLKWRSEEPELIDSFGTVHSEGVEESGAEVFLSLRLSEGNWPEEFEIPVRLLPPLLTEEEQQREAFLAYMKEEESRQRTEAQFQLPSAFEGRDISYRSSEGSPFWSLALLGVFAALAVSIKEKEDGRRKKEARMRQMLLDYSEVVSKLVIFLGAGMSIRTAWDRISEDYHRRAEAGKRPKRYAYEEMYAASCQMRTGVPEGRAFSEFGRRCGLQQYMKLSGLLEQSRKNGSKNLREALKLEMTDAFELRKHQARRLGEEAGTRLLVPLFMLLAVVMVMIAVPALMEFR